MCAIVVDMYVAVVESLGEYRVGHYLLSGMFNIHIVSPTATISYITCKRGCYTAGKRYSKYNVQLNVYMIYTVRTGFYLNEQLLVKEDLIFCENKKISFFGCET
jgi:hypothetical protein